MTTESAAGSRPCRRGCRCYLPTLLWCVPVGWVVAVFLSTHTDGDWRNLRPRLVVNALLIAFGLGPAVIGLLRGMLRHRRHCTRPAPRG